MNPIRLIVADDHVMVRLGLEQSISKQDDIELIASYRNGADTVKGYCRLMPDVLLLDYRLPDHDGIEIIERISQVDPRAKIVVYSAYEGEECIWRALEAGARGYVPKSSDISVTLRAIRNVAAGQAFLPEDVTAKIQSRSDRRALSSREHEVLELLAKGMCNKEIMECLSISASTVRHHVSNVLAKLDAFDRTHAVVKAARRGLIFFG